MWLGVLRFHLQFCTFDKKLYVGMKQNEFTILHNIFIQISD